MQFQHFRPAESKWQEDGISCRDIGHRYAFLRRIWNGDVIIGQRRPPDRVQSQINDFMLNHSIAFGYFLRRIQLGIVPLSIVEA